MLAVSISFCNLDFIGCHVIDIRIFKVSILCTFSLLFAVYGGPQLSRQNQKPHGKSKNITAKPKTSRQKQKHHGKTKNLTAKAKASRQNQKPHGKNKIPHGKTKNLTAEINSLTAKPNTSQQKQNIFGFVVSIYTVPLTGVRIKRVDFRENIWTFYRDKRNCPYKACVRIKRVFVERGSTVITILFTCGDVWVVPMTPAPKQYTVLH